MRKLNWEPTTLRQLTDIFSYYKQACSERTARKIILGIKTEAQRLKTSPFIGAREEYLEHLQKEYRYLVKGHYKIIYCIEDDHSIHIVTIFDCRLDPIRLKTLFK